MSVETKYEKKVLVLTKVKDESIFQLLTIKLGGCTLKIILIFKNIDFQMSCFCKKNLAGGDRYYLELWVGAL